MVKFHLLKFIIIWMCNGTLLIAINNYLALLVMSLYMWYIECFLSLLYKCCWEFLSISYHNAVPKIHLFFWSTHWSGLFHTWLSQKQYKEKHLQKWFKILLFNNFFLCTELMKVETWLNSRFHLSHTPTLINIL